MATIQFQERLSKIGNRTILLIPKSQSAKLPSRGMTLVEGTVNGFNIHTPLEPDGRGSHWLFVDDKLRKDIKAEAGDTVNVKINSSSNWPEPEIPTDFKKLITADRKIYELWRNITPMARWDWLRWISSTKNSKTRLHRMEVTVSKLKNGSKRPCCFNRSMCTVPEVSHNGVLQFQE